MIYYQVKEDRTVRPLPDDDFDRVPCWTVTRVSDGWHIAKYADEETAAKVADLLADFKEKELP